MSKPIAPEPRPMVLRAFTPVSGSERIPSIDVVRGIALLGILLVNAWFFAFPILVAVEPPGTINGAAAATTSDWTAWWFIQVFCFYKFISLFSLLFGAGAAIQFDRAKAANRPFDFFFVRRMIILLGFGLVHAIGFWYGDILVIYAIVGLWLLLFCRLSNRTLIGLGFIFLCIAAGLSAGMAAIQALAPANPLLEMTADELPENAWAAMELANFDPHAEAWTLAETRAYAKGPYSDLLIFRLMCWVFALVSAFASYGWHIMAMFALGVAALRAGLFEERGTGLRRIALRYALPIGLLLEAGCTYLTATMHAHDGVWVPIVTVATHEFSVPMVTFGYAALITTIVRSGACRHVVHAIACAGRMALTVYLAETLMMTGIFYFYGMRYFGDVERIWLIPIAFGVWAGLVGFATIWLHVYTRGPLEWLWRFFSYLRLPGRG